MNFFVEFIYEMYGTLAESPAEKRARLLKERDSRLLQFIKEGLPIAQIAHMEGLDHDGCRKACRTLAREHGVDYDPNKVWDRYTALPEGITEHSQFMRSRLADELYAYSESAKPHQLEMARLIGMTQRSQKYATQRPFTHNWSLSQIERLATARGTEFKKFIMRLIFTPEEYKKVLACLNR